MNDKQTVESSAEINTTRKYAKTAKYFQESWFQENPSWKEWVVKLEDETKFHCKICNKSLTCGKSEIVNHEKSRKHQENARRLINMTKYAFLRVRQSSDSKNEDCETVDYFIPVTNPDILPGVLNPENYTLSQKVREAELRITTFFIEHGLPLEALPKLVKLFQDMDPLVLENLKTSQADMVLKGINGGSNA